MKYSRVRLYDVYGLLSTSSEKQKVGGIDETKLAQHY